MDLFSEKWNFWFGQLKNRANVRKGIGIVEICIAGKKKARTFERYCVKLLETNTYHRTFGSMFADLSKH